MSSGEIESNDAETSEIRFFTGTMSKEETSNNIYDNQKRRPIRTNTKMSVNSAIQFSPINPSPQYRSVSEKYEDFGPWSKNREARAALLSTLSALYALVLVIMALAFEVSTFVADEVVSSRYDPFYIYLYVVGLLFLFYCHLFLLRTEGWKIPLPFYRLKSSSKSLQLLDGPVNQQLLDPNTVMSLKRKVTYSGNNAGSLYLRLGATVFGIVGMIDKALTIYSAADRGHVPQCYDGLNVAEDLLAIIFIFVQLYFIFQNSKIIIHKFKEIGRFGSMHLIATNLCIWIRAIVVEEYHIVKDLEHKLHRDAAKSHNYSSLFSPLGRHHNPQPLPGPLAYTISYEDHPTPLPLVGGETVRRLVGEDCHLEHKELDAIIRNAKPFTTTCIIEYAVICAAIMYVLWRNVGSVRHRKNKYRKHSVQIDCSSSTRGLFVGLLFVVFTIISMIIFFTKVQLEQNSQALWIFYFSDCVLYIVSIVAIGVGMFRMRNLHYVVYNHKGVLLDDILLIVALVAQLMLCIFSIVALTKIDLTSGMIVIVSVCRMVEVLLQTVFIVTAQRLVALSPKMQVEKPGRELITFLLLSNLAMFLINTFETQKAGSNPITIEFYGKSIWTVIVYSTVPLNTFYRFHSSVCFAEIWKTTYRYKMPELV